jgi:predicted acylesterase/phospholipase RssA
MIGVKHPDWVAGISIGAINSALIAGNAPKDRVAKLRDFWQVSGELFGVWMCVLKNGYVEMIDDDPMGFIDRLQ